MSKEIRWNRIIGSKLIKSVTLSIGDEVHGTMFNCKECVKFVDLSQYSQFGEKMAEQLNHTCVQCIKDKGLLQSFLEKFKEHYTDQMCRDYILLEEK